MSATKSEFFQSSTTSSTLKGGVLPNESNNVSGSLPWTILTDRLSHISLMPHDVGGSGDCFLNQFHINSIKLHICTLKFGSQE